MMVLRKHHVCVRVSIRGDVIDQCNKSMSRDLFSIAYRIQCVDIFIHVCCLVRTHCALQHKFYVSHADVLLCNASTIPLLHCRFVQSCV